MPAISNAQIMEKIGNLDARVGHAENSRRVLHEKLDAQDDVLNEVSKRLAELGYLLKTTTDVAEQTRDKITHVEQELHALTPVVDAAAAFKVEAEPILAVIKTVRNIVVGLAALGIFSVGGVIAAAVWFGEWLRAGIVAYLQTPFGG